MIAYDEKVRFVATLLFECQTFQQSALQTVGVLKLIDEEKLVTLRSARQHFGTLEQFKRAQFQIVKIKRRDFLLFFVCRTL